MLQAGPYPSPSSLGGGFRYNVPPRTPASNVVHSHGGADRIRHFVIDLPDFNLGSGVAVYISSCEVEFPLEKHTNKPETTVPNRAMDGSSKEARFDTFHRRQRRGPESRDMRFRCLTLDDIPVKRLV